MDRISINSAIVLLVFEAIGLSIRNIPIIVNEFGFIITFLLCLFLLFAIFYSLHLIIELR